jgi:hypothetical protein
MVFFLILIPIYLLFVLQAKSDSTWKLAFREGAKVFLFSSLFSLCALFVVGTPLLLANSVFGENSNWAGVLGPIGGIVAFVAFATIINRKFPFF